MFFLKLLSLSGVLHGLEWEPGSCSLLSHSHDFIIYPFLAVAMLLFDTIIYRIHGNGRKLQVFLHEVVLWHFDIHTQCLLSLNRQCWGRRWPEELGTCYLVDPSVAQPTHLSAAGCWGQLGPLDTWALQQCLSRVHRWAQRETVHCSGTACTETGWTPSWKYSHLFSKQQQMQIIILCTCTWGRAPDCSYFYCWGGSHVRCWGEWGCSLNVGKAL